MNDVLVSYILLETGKKHHLHGRERDGWPDEEEEPAIFSSFSTAEARQCRALNDSITAAVPSEQEVETKFTPSLQPQTASNVPC